MSNHLNARQLAVVPIAAFTATGQPDKLEAALNAGLAVDWNSLLAGSQTQTQLVGQPVSGPLFDFAPAIDTWLKAHLFGDIFQRDVLDWPTRELATVSALAVLGGVNSQLKSHFAISLNVGFRPEQLIAFTALLKQHCGAEIAENARAVLDECI
ncbi:MULTISPECIES: carboxymuconolactone decarboxylase family protein [Citrobacter]|uniref:carboxymuconolactone decarboxylase family protein n=1 Tax=Citrobacter TaxID=544 RepID=UPI000EF23244|nr:MULTISPECIES: carboxymuconolactone decarboxylase family protein [Citrobacter]AYL61695.1 4-carboxymuconolactone decarboxylase [Citrobacter pasteurii]MBA8106028.1 carboxymuconolactone decarboxylase family protein [Citrobacter sp. RHBSTW-00029]MBJ8883506.1 carboxymuconolactone decarboxylase family protein [Citrobacter sp. FDAARGOS_156]MDU5628314.1 carboxymuconolactone decarboxylase family protein [Citrobacter sp.]NHM09777.1 carboxymuconolactone decarboxylase family protein [Citrobacter youngae